MNWTWINFVTGRNPFCPAVFERGTVHSSVILLVAFMQS